MISTICEGIGSSWLQCNADGNQRTMETSGGVELRLVRISSSRYYLLFSTQSTQPADYPWCPAGYVHQPRISTSLY